MAVKDQVITDRYAIYNGDSCDVLTTMPDDSIDMAVFSPPFADLYCYSDNPADLGNNRTYAEFFAHFGFIISELVRVIKPGRICAVHCIDIPAHEGARWVYRAERFSRRHCARISGCRVRLSLTARHLERPAD